MQRKLHAFFIPIFYLIKKEDQVVCSGCYHAP